MPSRRHTTVHTKCGKSWKPQISGKLPQILRDRKLWNPCIYFSGTEWNCCQSKHNIQNMSSTWQIWQRATTCRHLQMKNLPRRSSKRFCFVILSFRISGVFPPFRHSAVPLFYRSTVRSFGLLGSPLGDRNLTINVAFSRRPLSRGAVRKKARRFAHS